MFEHLQFIYSELNLNDLSFYLNEKKQTKNKQKKESARL